MPFWPPSRPPIATNKAVITASNTTVFTLFIGFCLDSVPFDFTIPYEMESGEVAEGAIKAERRSVVECSGQQGHLDRRLLAAGLVECDPVRLEGDPPACLLQMRGELHRLGPARIGEQQPPAGSEVLPKDTLEMVVRVPLVEDIGAEEEIVAGLVGPVVPVREEEVEAVHVVLSGVEPG